MDNEHIQQENKIVELAKKEYMKKKAACNTEFTAQDALTYALEELDTGYDLTPTEYDQLLMQTNRACECA